MNFDKDAANPLPGNSQRSRGALKLCIAVLSTIVFAVVNFSAMLNSHDFSSADPARNFSAPKHVASNAAPAEQQFYSGGNCPAQKESIKANSCE